MTLGWKTALRGTVCTVSALALLAGPVVAQGLQDGRVWPVGQGMQGLQAIQMSPGNQDRMAQSPAAPPAAREQAGTTSVPLPGAGAPAPASPEGVRSANQILQSEEGFISFDTVMIGCTAGAAAGALSVAMPAVTAASTGIGRSAARSALSAEWSRSRVRWA